jgi:hypothetical protein
MSATSLITVLLLCLFISSMSETLSRANFPFGVVRLRVPLSRAEVRLMPPPVPLEGDEPVSGELYVEKPPIYPEATLFFGILGRQEPKFLYNLHVFANGTPVNSIRAAVKGKHKKRYEFINDSTAMPKNKHGVPERWQQDGLNALCSVGPAAGFQTAEFQTESPQHFTTQLKQHLKDNKVEMEVVTYIGEEHRWFLSFMMNGEKQ